MCRREGKGERWQGIGGRQRGNAGAVWKWQEGVVGRQAGGVGQEGKGVEQEGGRCLIEGGGGGGARGHRKKGQGEMWRVTENKEQRESECSEKEMPEKCNETSQEHNSK